MVSRLCTWGFEEKNEIIFCITNEISFTIISLSSSDKFFLESGFFIRSCYYITNYHRNLLSFTLYIILIQHILVFSFLLEKCFMDGVYVIFILVEHHLSFFFYFYILEELCFMVHTFIIQILGFQEFFFYSY